MTDKEYRQAIALFRYRLIAEFLQLPAGCMRARATKPVPSTAFRTARVPRVAAATLRHWLKNYRRGGFDALHAQGARRSWPSACAAPGGGRCAREPEGRAAGAVDPAVDPRRARKRCRAPCPGAAAIQRAPALEPRRPLARGERRAEHPGSAPLRLRPCRPTLDERYHARPQRCHPRARAAKALSHRLPRRRHPGGALLRPCQ
jgi:hypothetical protein